MEGKDIHKVGNDIHIVEDGSRSMMTVISANGLTTTGGTPSEKAPLNNPPDSTSISKTKPWSIWGDNDSFPNELLETLSKLGVARSALDINSDFHYGSGIVWMKEKAADSGKMAYELANPPRWRNWAFESGFNSALSDDINSRDTFGLSFIRVRLSKDGKIYSLDTLDTPSCRLGKRDKNGRISSIFYAHEINLKSGTDKDVIELKLYDSEKHKEFIEKNKVFVVLVSTRTWGRFYYPEPNYIATINNGWADIAIEVPKLIKNIYKNQATLKYHIKIPYNIFLKKYKCFEEKTEKEQIEIMSAYKKDIDDIISKAESAGSSVFTIYEDGQDKVEITSISDALNTSKDLPNNIAANSEILFAIGVAPSIIGLNMPGGKDLNGSGGSQLRESVKAKQMTLTRERIKSLEFCYLVKKLQGFPEDIFPMFVDIDISQTLDENPTGKKTVVGG